MIAYPNKMMNHPFGPNMDLEETARRWYKDGMKFFLMQNYQFYIPYKVASKQDGPVLVTLLYLCYHETFAI